MGNKKKKPSQEQMQNTAKVLVNALTSETKDNNKVNGYSNRTVGIADRLADLVNYCRSTLPIIDIINNCGCLDATSLHTEFRKIFFDNYTNNIYKQNTYSKFVADIRDNRANIRELAGIFCICRDMCDRLYGRELDKNGNKKMLSFKYILTGKGEKFIFADTTDISKVKYSVIEETLCNAIGITDDVTKYTIDELATMIENCDSKFDEVLIHYTLSMTFTESPSEVERRDALTDEDTDAVKVITGAKDKKGVNSADEQSPLHDDNTENEEEVEKISNPDELPESVEDSEPINEKEFTEEPEFEFPSEEEFKNIKGAEEDQYTAYALEFEKFHNDIMEIEDHEEKANRSEEKTDSLEDVEPDIEEKLGECHKIINDTSEKIDEMLKRMKDFRKEQPYEKVYCDYGESEYDETEKDINSNHVYYVLEKRDDSSLLYNISTGETEYHSNSMKNVIENGDVNGILKSINYSSRDEVERALRLVTLIVEQGTLLRV